MLNLDIFDLFFLHLVGVYDLGTLYNILLVMSVDGQQGELDHLKL